MHTPTTTPPLPTTFPSQGCQRLMRNSLRSGGLRAFLGPTAQSPGSESGPDQESVRHLGAGGVTSSPNLILQPPPMSPLLLPCGETAFPCPRVRVSPSSPAEEPGAILRSGGRHLPRDSQYQPC